MKKRLLSTFMALLMVCSIVMYLPAVDIRVCARVNGTANFSRNYTLTGDGATDMVAIARAQLGKNGATLGYSAEEWCADFVIDCAILAGQSSVIPNTAANAGCENLLSSMTTNGRGKRISASEAKAGDILFYGSNGGSHVEIVYAQNGSTLYSLSTIGGNSGNSDNSLSMVKNHTNQNGQPTPYCVVHPYYGGGILPILPGTVDTRYNTNVSCTAPSQIHTYNEYGNRESDRWVAAGDSCIAIEAYTNGYWKINYPASGSRRNAYMKLSEWNPFANTILPGTVNTKYKTNVSCTAPSKINTYDANGNLESNRWVDAGDSCIAIEAYTNGYWKIDYPASGSRRIAYMKLSEWNPFASIILPGTVDSKSTDLPISLILFRPCVFDGISSFCGTNGRKLFMDFTVFLPFRLPLSTEFQDLLSKCPTCYCIFSPLYLTAFYAVLFSALGLLPLLLFSALLS